MLASDAGFAATGIVAGKARDSNDDAITHRSTALGSMAFPTGGTAIMWFGKD